MAPTLLTLPRELRELIYGHYFAAYSACTHGGSVQVFKEPKKFTSARSWCPQINSKHACLEGGVTRYTAEWVERVSFNVTEEFIEQARNDEMESWSEYKPECCTGIPHDLLLVNKVIYHEASEKFLQLPVHFKFPESDITAFARRWHHASPEKNVRSIVVEWTTHEWFPRRWGVETESAVGDWTLALLATTFPAVEHVKVHLGEHNPHRYYSALRSHLESFRLLKDINILDEDIERGTYVECTNMAMGYTPMFSAPCKMNGCWVRIWDPVAYEKGRQKEREEYEASRDRRISMESEGDDTGE
ncbi:hypothetical protein LTR56_010483 [Elasticomyces elasticus]|nr:hypothetical protein LTR56_010483 [Elasticomyces elasticus]KAK3657899.1 hypothetical protein LTR22_009126 [Elasticomyces elasticus]KAK4917585.1 hypothetical protein LTR49_014539 [Elasticomyces elasticus]KAK5762805.1 hypothetical protein LTS12_006994 [Elasticomyces elasticus]